MVVRTLSTELRKKAENELNEDPARIEKDLDHIRQWLAKQYHLRVRLDDQWLISFLRGCKFSLQKTKEKIDYFYTGRSLIPEFFSNRDPFQPHIQNVLRAGCVFPFLKIEDPTPRIVLFNCSAFDYEAMTVEDIIKVFTMVSDLLMFEVDDCVVSGINILVDFKNFSLHYLPQLTLTLIKKAIICLQHVYPLRIKGIYLVNASAAFEAVYKAVQFLLNSKLRNRFFIFKEDDFAKIYKHLPKEALPVEYGGSYGRLKDIADYWKDRVEDHRKWFLEDDKYCCDESKRIGTPKTTADLFGVEGTFRKLEID